eukprot:SAG31_NODE_20038_length_585_cov_1.063786_1_plen_37_part_10
MLLLVGIVRLLWLLSARCSISRTIRMIAEYLPDSGKT